MQIIINFFLVCAKISDKAIYFRPFWNSLIPYKLYIFFMGKSLRLTVIKYNISGWEKYKEYYRNIMRIADLLPEEEKQEFIEDMI